MQKRIRAPVLRLEKIREIVEQFRVQYPLAQQVPIDALSIAEFDLKLEFVPLKGLKRTADVSAFLTCDRTQIMIDLDEFLLEKFERRLRFSVAHEIGHYVLHENVYKGGFDRNTRRLAGFSTVDRIERIQFFGNACK